MNFRDRTVTVNGTECPMEILSSGHPVLRVDDFGRHEQFESQFCVTPHVNLPRKASVSHEETDLDVSEVHESDNAPQIEY